MNRVKKGAVLFFLMLICCVAQGESLSLEFRQVSPKGGFTFGSVYQITEDAHGFIWFGSHQGLFRYDTESFEKFVHVPTDSTSIPSNYVTSISKDQNQKLWISTDRGICFYNEQKANFERCHFYNGEGQELRSNILNLLSVSTEKLFILCDRNLSRTLYVANPETHRFDSVEVAPNDNFVHFIHKDTNNRLWLQSSMGNIYWSDSPYATFHFFGQASEKTIISMLYSHDKLWIGYEWEGVECYGNSGTLIAKYGIGNANGQYDIRSNRVRKIYEDGEGRIWFGTYNGIVVLEEGQFRFFNMKNTPGLLHSSIFDIFTDRNGGIWVGTWAGTLSYSNPYDNLFEYVSTDDGLSDNVVSSVAELNGKLWIGTERGGLNAYDIQTGKITKYLLNRSFADEQNIKSLLVDSNKALWVGTFNDGLWVIRDFDSNGNPLNPKKVLQGGFYDLEEDGSQILAATYFHGLYKIDGRTFESANYEGNTEDSLTVSSSQLRNLLLDSKGNLWIGSQEGLNLKRKNSDVFVRFFSNSADTTSLSGNQVYCIFEDHAQQVWIGTSSGLSRYNEQKNNFRNFSPQNGLSGYEIYGITEDSKGRLWLSTDNGVTEFDTQNGSSRSFDIADGLQGNQFNPGAVFRSSNGQIYFGGPNGLTIFNPDHIKINVVPPTPSVISVAINNQLQRPGDSTSILQESILSANNFILNYDQNSLTFRFVANNYLSPKKNNFCYRLLNYDDKWIYIGTKKSATYTKIPPGNYVFQVKASNNDGIWNEVPTEISFKIMAPWWKRWYAYSIYLIFVMGLAAFVQREIMIRQKLKNEILLEKIRSSSEQELIQSKLVFFTNISHEIKTPLSLILSPLDYIMERRQSDRELVDSLKTIQRNGNRLKYLLHQIIDIRRMEAGKIQFAPMQHNVVDILREVYGCFLIEAQERNIDFKILSPFDTLMALIDPDKFDKIVFNLLTNAFKFVPDNGTVTVTITVGSAEKNSIVGDSIADKYFELAVFNSGSFIPKDEFLSIFDRFYQGKENKKRGTGIGLHMVREYTLLHHGQINVTSDKEKGTNFEVRIPVSDAPEIVIEGNSPMQILQSDTLSGTSLGKHDDLNRNMILIVEDNAELRAFLKKTLQNWYSVITASNGKMGLEQAIELNPNLIISDVMMPEMDGFELCRRIKGEVSTSHIPVILLTALAGEDSQIEGYRIGADAYIAKPFSEKLLHSQIDALLETRQKLKEKFLDPENSNDSENSDSIVARAVAIVEDHLLDQNFSVEVLADELKISRATLHRKLKSLTDQSSTEFIRFVRLKKAMRMLKSGNYTIDEISYAVGFNSPSYFSQSFKRQFGKMPKEYLVQSGK